MKIIFNWKIVILLIVGLCLWVTIAGTWTAPDWRKGELYVALPPDGSDDDAKFELELVSLFARRLNIKVKPVPMDYDQITHALASHKVHMAAAGLRGNAESTLRFGMSYQTLSEQVVCKKSPPKRLDDLAKRSLIVVAESAQENALRSIAKHQPNLHWEAWHQLSTSGLLQQLAEGKIDCAVANEEQIATARNFHPELGSAFDLNTQSRLAWAFAVDSDAVLFQSADDFISAIKKDGSLAALLDRHYGHNERLETVDAVAFVSKARSVLPHFKRWFQEASALTGIEWQLLAALAYQESHWDPLATSYTNVRGLMMLTEETADRMNLDDRLDAHASIIAGAKYLQLLKEALPDRMDENERTWMALAAYNQGMGHLEDARVLAVKSNLNPDVWSDVKKVMPLLSRPAYFEQAKHGRARGGEAVILVETVRLYYDMLNRLPHENMQSLPSTPYFGLKPGHTLNTNSH